MKNSTPLFKTLLVAAATMSFCVAPTWADEITLTEDATTIYASSLSDTTATFGAASYVIAEASESGWIFANQSTGTAPMQNYTTIVFATGTTFSGNGLLGIYFHQGYANATETVDLTNVDASGLTGQLCVENDYADPTIVRISGTTWSNVEYLFGDNGGAHQGNDSIYTLTLVGDTIAFAGISGTTAGAGETITVETAGASLTLAGSGEYGYNGALATDSARASIVMNSSDGTGKQTFGGTNYLQNVTVTAGTLALGGTTDISGAVSVTGGTLDISGSTTFGSTVTVVENGTLELSGEITLSSAITNSGTVIIDSDVVFDLTNLGTENDTYVIITNSGTGSITGWGNLDYSNFSINGETLTSSRQIIFGTDGSITYDESGTAQNLTWAGISGDNTWTNSSLVTNWTNGVSPDYFAGGDSVTFDGTAGSRDVTVSGTVHAGSMTVTTDGYVFSGDVLKADSLTLNVSRGSVLTIKVSEAEFGSISLVANNEGTGSGYHSLAFGDESNTTTATTGSLSLLGNSEISVATGSSLTVTGDASFGGGYGESISGGGTLIVEGTATFSTNGASTVSISNFQASDVAFKGSGGLTISSTNFQADTFTISAPSNGSSLGSLTFSSSGAIDIGTMTVGAAGNITFGGGGIYTIGSYSTTTTGGSTLTLGEGTQVTMGKLSAAWHETVTLGTGATLTVTEELSVHTATTDTFSGGTINAEKLNIYNASTIASFSDTNLNIGSGGIVNTGSSGYFAFGDGLTVGVYEGANGDNTSWSSSAEIHFTGTSTGTTFNTKEGETITLSGTVSGNGSMTKTGAGTLELSGANTYSGGTTISKGTVVAGSSSALGAGNVSVASGATLQLNTTVSISGNSSTVAFAEGAKLIISGDLLTQLETATLAANGDAVAIIIANDISFGEQSVSDASDLDSLINDYVSAGNYLLTWTWNDGTLSASIVRTIPEPSMFGLFFGLGAIGLVATRRRRRKVA